MTEPTLQELTDILNWEPSDEQYTLEQFKEWFDEWKAGRHEETTSGADG